MTQKELLYLEDAVGHESNIISIIGEIVNNLSDENLVAFMNMELEKHESMKENLLNMLKEKANDGSTING